MVKRKFNTIKEFMDNLHRGEVSVINFDGKPIPCIHIDNERYREIIRKVAGKKLAVDILLDIFHDKKIVFVDIDMTYQGYGIEENYLLYANDKKEFFQAMATTGIIGILPIDSSSTTDIFMVQIPKVAAAKSAWEQIKSIISKDEIV